MAIIKVTRNEFMFWLLLVLAAAATTHTSTRPSSSTNNPDKISCDQARLKCAFRVGCGMALHNYMIGCSDLMAGRIDRCPTLCSRALIALTSTDEGQALETCDCNGSQPCVDAKRTVEPCRPIVSRASLNASIVSCTVAQWICAVDPLCSTALEYYHRFCRALVQGRKCTPRCNNSIAILRRQEKAAKLGSCVCDGTEDFDCPAIKNNTDRLCFPYSKHQSPYGHPLPVPPPSSPSVTPDLPQPPPIRTPPSDGESTGRNGCSAAVSTRDGTLWVTFLAIIIVYVSATF